jgi:PTS system beta-glucosides-specific IIC component
MDNKKLANEVLEKVGGKENVANVIHCMTRLRFTLIDDSKADREAVKKVSGVISLIEKGGQFQVVIGNSVSKVYEELVPMLGNEVNSNHDNTHEKDTAKKKESLFDMFSRTVSGIFAPTLGVISACGVLQGILAICIVSGWLTKTDSTYLLLYGISNVIFYFFPIFLGASAAVQFGMKQYLGMAVGACLVYPTFILAATDGSISSLFSIPMKLSNYTSTVFPVIIAVYLGAKLEKLLKKVVPDVISFFTVPLLVLLVIVPLTLWIVGPVTNLLSSFLSKVVLGAYSFNPVIAGLLIGGPWIVLVMFGLHWAFIPIFINNLVTLQQEPVMGLLAANQMAMAGSVLAAAILIKNKTKKSGAVTAGITCLLGISEPTLYGYLIPLKTPMIASVFAGSIGGALSGAFGTTKYAMGGSGVIGIPTYLNPDGLDAGFYGLLLSMAIGLIIGFILTFILLKRDQKRLEEF